MASADEALYRAKGNGRDWIESAGTERPRFVAPTAPREPEPVGA